MGEGQEKITPSNPRIQFAINININHSTAQVRMVNDTSCTD
jgi:hypothetical protein